MLNTALNEELQKGFSSSLPGSDLPKILFSPDFRIPEGFDYKKAKQEICNVMDDLVARKAYKQSHKCAKLAARLIGVSTRMFYYIVHREKPAVPPAASETIQAAAQTAP